MDYGVFYLLPTTLFEQRVWERKLLCLNLICPISANLRHP